MFTVSWQSLTPRRVDVVHVDIDKKFFIAVAQSGGRSLESGARIRDQIATLARLERLHCVLFEAAALWQQLFHFIAELWTDEAVEEEVYDVVQVHHCVGARFVNGPIGLAHVVLGVITEIFFVFKWNMSLKSGNLNLFIFQPNVNLSLA